VRLFNQCIFKHYLYTFCVLTLRLKSAHYRLNDNHDTMSTTCNSQQTRLLCYQQITGEISKENQTTYCSHEPKVVLLQLL